jgi:5-methylcytosine-specific restriction protein A
MSNPFHHETRKRFTPKERAEIFAASGGQCAKCTRKLFTGDDWDIDHVIALSRGGTNEPSNLAVLCSWCHDDKSADDTAGAAKSKRVFTKAVVPSRFRRSRSWGRR